MTYSYQAPEDRYRADDRKQTIGLYDPKPDPFVIDCHAYVSEAISCPSNEPVFHSQYGLMGYVRGPDRSSSIRIGTEFGDIELTKTSCATVHELYALSQRDSLGRVRVRIEVAAL